MFDLDKFNYIMSGKYEDINNYIKSVEEELLDKGYEDRFYFIIRALNDDKRKNVKGLSLMLQKALKARETEMNRVKLLYNFDKAFSKGKILAGVDEVGRGPLAGPIVAAAVILRLDADNNELILNINDSKKVSPHNREKLSEIILERALAVSISVLDNKEIDRKGIGWCNNEVLKNSSEGLKMEPDIVLSDGYSIKGIKYENRYVVKGDSKSASIACASIVAKVYRDNLMKEYAIKYPQYGFEKHVGYGTSEHIKAIEEFGICDIHRRSFLKNII